MLNNRSLGDVLIRAVNINLNILFIHIIDKTCIFGTLKISDKLKMS